MKHGRIHGYILLSVCLFLAAACATGAGGRASHESGLGTEPSPLSSLASEPIAPPDPQVPVSAKQGSPALSRCEMFVRPGVVRRTSLIEIVNAGLPRWLHGVEGDRVLAKHHFVGWLIKSMYPGDPCYQQVELRSGDIVQRVNGFSIEKPEQAFDVLQTLKTATSFAVDYLRDGKSEKMTLSISDE